MQCQRWGSRTSQDEHGEDWDRCCILEQGGMVAFL